MTGKFVILFLHKNEAEKEIKWPCTVCHRLSFPQILRNEIISLAQALSSRSRF